MKKIEIPSEEAVPLGTLTPDIAALRTLLVNVAAVSSEKSWVLVDAGIAGYAGSILRWARANVSASPPLAIVLTHGHFDHVGSLDGLLREWDVPVYAHPDELPFITGELAYPPPDPTVGGGLMARIAAVFPRQPIDLKSRAKSLPADGSVPGLPTWRWLPTPGHSPGHVSFFRDADRSLVAGDAFCTTRQESLMAVMTQRPELHGPPAYFTTDWDAARESVRRLASLAPRLIVAGHGPPMSGEHTTAALRELAERFDEVARPEHGHYVTRRDW